MSNSNQKNKKKQKIAYLDLDEADTIRRLELVRRSGKCTDEDRIGQWLLTISTNVVPLGPEHELELRNALRDAFLEYAQLLYGKDSEYVVLVGGKSKRITKIEVSYATEVGVSKYGGRVHLHADLELTHCDKIHLNYSKARQFFESKLVGRLGIVGIYIHWEVNRPKSEILRYLTKQKQPLVLLKNL